MLPRFVRYDGRTGIARKQADDKLRRRLEEQRTQPSE
jgi:hypothetical protein